MRATCRVCGREWRACRRARGARTLGAGADCGARPSRRHTACACWGIINWETQREGSPAARSCGPQRPRRVRRAVLRAPHVSRMRTCASARSGQLRTERVAAAGRLPASARCHGAGLAGASRWGPRGLVSSAAAAAGAKVAGARGNLQHSQSVRELQGGAVAAPSRARSTCYRLLNAAAMAAAASTAASAAASAAALCASGSCPWAACAASSALAAADWGDRAEQGLAVGRRGRSLHGARDSGACGTHGALRARASAIRTRNAPPRPNTPPLASPLAHHSARRGCHSAVRLQHLRRQGVVGARQEVLCCHHVCRQLTQRRRELDWVRQGASRRHASGWVPWPGVQRRQSRGVRARRAALGAPRVRASPTRCAR